MPNKRFHDFLTMAARNWDEMERVARAMHEDRNPHWHSIVTESTDPVAIEGAEAQGMEAFTIERWWQDD